MGSSLKQWEILLVEDNPADVRLTQEAFKGLQLNHRLQVASDAVAALKYLNSFRSDQLGTRPDIIILDLNLPGMSGLDLLSVIKSDDSIKTIPVIIMSSSNASSDVTDAYRLNANCYARKPLEIDSFFEVIENISRLWMKTAILPDVPARTTH